MEEIKEQFDYETITFEEMKQYIEKNAPKDKAWFKKQAIGKRKIKDKNLLWLIEQILFAQSREKGLEIGNYTSQMFANIYLNEIDQYIKHKLKIKYYCRYLDDSLLMVKTKQEAKEALKKIKQILKEHLELE